MHALARRPRHGAQDRRRASPCRWCRRHGSPAAGARSGWPSAASSRSMRPERQVDQLRMQRVQPLEDRLTSPRRCIAPVSAPFRPCGASSVSGRAAHRRRRARGADPVRRSRSRISRPGSRAARRAAPPCRPCRAPAGIRRAGSLGQLLADGLLDHPRAGEADQRAGLGDVDVAQHGEGGGDAAGGRVGQHARCRAAPPPSPRSTAIVVRGICISEACPPACGRRRRR